MPSLQMEPLAQWRDGACGHAIHCDGGALGLFLAAMSVERPVPDIIVRIAAAMGALSGFSMINVMQIVRIYLSGR